MRNFIKYFVPTVMSHVANSYTYLYITFGGMFVLVCGLPLMLVYLLLVYVLQFPVLVNIGIMAFLVNYWVGRTVYNYGILTGEAMINDEIGRLTRKLNHVYNNTNNNDSSNTQ